MDVPAMSFKVTCNRVFALLGVVFALLGVEFAGACFGAFIPLNLYYFQLLSIWWLPIGILLGCVVFSEAVYLFITGRMVFHPRHWVRLPTCHRVYIPTGRDMVIDWCADHCRGAWLISKDYGADGSIIAFNRKSDYAMFILFLA